MPLRDSTDHAFLGIAATAVDAHRLLHLADATPFAARSTLDQAHVVLTAVHRLLEDHAAPTSPTAAGSPHALPHLRAARDLVWQAAEQIHRAYHHAPRNGASSATRVDPSADACHRGLPEGAPDLTICQRHLLVTTRARRHSTPADLRNRMTGQSGHATPGAAS